MGTRKLLNRLTDFFNLDAKGKAKHKEDMEDVLRRLKQKEQELKARLEQETDSQERQKLQQKIDLVQGQTRKGETTLFELDDDNRD